MTRLDVPRIPVPATYSNVILQYPEHWLPLWQSFATQATLWRPDEGMLLGFLLLALWLERVLAFLELALSRRIAAALLLAFASLLIPTVAWITVLAAIFVTIVGFASNRTKWSPVRMGVTILAVFITALVWLAVNNLTHAINRKAASSYDSVQRAEQANGVADTATDTATSSVTTTAASSVTKGNEQVARGYMAFDAQNLPAKFELPSGERSSSFAEQMLAADRPQSVTIVLLSMTLVTWLAAALAAGAAWLLWRERATIKATLRARMAAAASTVAPTVAPA